MTAERSHEARRWRPTPLLAGSALAHLIGLGVLAMAPRVWPWLLGGSLVDHVLMAGAGCWPKSRLLGPNLTRLNGEGECESGVALTFDDGPDPEITPQVLDLLDAAGHKATFFFVGERALEHPLLVQQVAQRGHSIQNHSHCHSHLFAFYGPRRLGAEIDRAQSAISQITGVTPHLFRAPAGVRGPLLEPVLARRGLFLASWTRRGFDAVRRNSDKILSRLVDGLNAGDVLLLHDGTFFRRGSAGAASPPVLNALPGLIEVLEERGFRSMALTRSLTGSLTLESSFT